MSESKEPPRLPDVVDEAGDSPTWVPLLGLGLLCALALFIAAREAIGHHETPPAEAATAQDAGAEPLKQAPAAKPPG